MSFLSLAFLSALPLAAAPLLLHFFDRRRDVVIEWGAMQFLQEAATKRTRARRLKEWCLLLMRMAALTALILALARPLVPGNWFGMSERNETILIIDNSMSMMRDAGGRPLFEQLVSQATETLRELQPGDSVRVLLASPYPAWMTAGSVRADATSVSHWAGQLEDVRPTDGSSDLLAALFTAVQADAAPALEQRQVVLFTDGQRNDWKLDDVAGWKRLQETLSAAPVPTQLDVVELEGTAGTRNLAVQEIRTSRTVLGVHQSLSVTAKIQNHSRRSSPNGRVSWLVDDQQKSESELKSIGGNDAREVVWKHAFERTGVYAVSCRVESGDALVADNRATVVVEVVDRVPVLLVEGARELADVQQDAFFVQAALGRIEGEADAFLWQSVFAPRTINHEALETIDLANYRAVVVPNVTELSQLAVQRLYEFVSDGGGLWLALGPRTNIDAFNHDFFHEGDGLSPLRIAGAIQETDGETSHTKINPFGHDHAAVAGLADVERLDTADVKVNGRLRFKTGLTYQETSILLELTNGEPLAAENFLGRGRVIVQGIPLRYQWSDLALSQAFVVMVHDWLAYLTQPRTTRHNLSPGDPITVHLADAQFTEAILTTPHGDEVELASDPAGDGVVFRSSRTVLPGEYLLELGLSGERIPFYVQRDARESDLKTLSAADRQMLTETAGLSERSVGQQLTGTNQRDPMWPLLLLVLIGLISGELLLSGVIARQRFGSDSITETTEAWMEQASSVALFGQQSPFALPKDAVDQTEAKEQEHEKA